MNFPRLMRHLRLCTCVALLASGAQSLHAQTATAPAPDSPRSYWMIVSGLSGEDEIASKYKAWAAQVERAARERFHASRILVLSESASADSSSMSTKANIGAQLRSIAADARSGDALFLVIIGHGSAGESSPRVALPGPDLSAAELARMLVGIPARITVVNTSSASGGWVAPLAANGRIVMTATRSGVEQNETTFGGYFAAALSSDDTDTDKDGRISVLEAYDYARREVERAYASDKRLLTEHAQIDGDGDGKAVTAAPIDSPDGAIASLTFFGASGVASSGAATAAQMPALRALYAEKAVLEQKLARLRGHKADLPDADYQKQLEALLLEIARNGQSIRRLESGK